MRIGKVVLAVSLAVGACLVVEPAAGAAPGPRPDFQLPFPCGQKWQLNSWAHAPALDMVKEPDQVGTEGAPFVAAADGVVRQSFFHDNAGNMIQIDHGGGWFTTGIHLQSRSVSVGQRVTQGQVVGRVGHTGPTSNGHPHLHFEQAYDANGDGRATWGAENTERVVQVFDGKQYATQNGQEYNNVTSQNCPENPGKDSLGYYSPVDGSFHLRNLLNNGASDYAWDTDLNTAVPNAVVLRGDWDGNGRDSTGYYNPGDGSFHLGNDLGNSPSEYAWDTDLNEAVPNAVLLVGDWNGDGKDSLGYHSPVDGSFHLRNLLNNGASDYAWDTDLNTAVPNARILVGDWNDDGKDSTGYYSPGDGSFHLRDLLNSGASDHAWDTDLNTAVPGAVVLTGDWNGDGRDSTGYYNPGDGSFHLGNDLGNSPSEYAWDTDLNEAVPNAVLLVGDWNGS
jgi:hypothetical protein